MQYKTEENQTWTVGLSKLGQSELRIWVKEANLMVESRRYLETVVQYIQQNNVFIRAGETLNYGYWLTKFQESNNGFLDVWEYDLEGTDFVYGATFTLTCWQQQHDLCKRLEANFTPPVPDQLVVISTGVLEGELVGGARFTAPNHMSGWWITTDRYNGDVSTLTVHHLYHITAIRPDIARYIALPYGYRFLQDKEQESVWFDATILANN